MKMPLVLGLALPVVLAACGAAKTSSVTANAAAVSAPSLVVYSADQRMVDGALEVLTLTLDGDGYSASLRSAYYDRIAGKSVDQTKTLASGLQCVFSDAGADCARDLRPVDGDLKALKVARSAQGLYDATLRIAYFDRVGGRAVDVTSTIAAGLHAGKTAEK